MFKPLRKKTPINNFLIDLPSPSNISLWWNFGSLLGMCLIIQIISGLFLSMHYSPNINNAFSSIIHIMRDVNYGWLMRNTHANGASLFFMLIYIHLSRGLYYGSFKLKKNMNLSNINSVNINSNCFFSMCFTLGTNIILSSNSNHKLSFSSSMYWNHNS